MLTVIDEYTREALAVAVKPKMGSADVLEALHSLILKRGNRMAPSYVMKKGKIAYRYYVSAPALRASKKKPGTISRVYASWLERFVIDALSTRLAIPTDEAEALTSTNVEKVTVFSDAMSVVRHL